MAVKVVRRRELTYWEKLYVPQILSGLKITFAHFFRNLFLHTAHLLGRLKNIPASATIQFPEELRPLMSRFRSRHRLTRREDQTPRCVGCMLCETVCPAKCITIVPGEHPDSAVPHKGRRLRCLWRRAGNSQLPPRRLAARLCQHRRRPHAGLG